MQHKAYFSTLTIEQLHKFLHEYDILVAHLRTIDRRIIADKEKFTKYADVISNEREIIKAVIHLKQELEKKEQDLLNLSLNFTKLREQDMKLHKELQTFEQHLDTITHTKK